MILRRPFRKLGQLKIDATRPEVALRYRRMPDALRFSLALGTHGVYYCASLTAVLLANGAMDLRAMALATAAMSFESLSRGRYARRASCGRPNSRKAARVRFSHLTPHCVSVQQILRTAYT